MCSWLSNQVCSLVAPILSSWQDHAESWSFCTHNIPDYGNEEQRKPSSFGSQPGDDVRFTILGPFLGPRAWVAPSTACKKNRKKLIWVCVLQKELAEIKCHKITFHEGINSIKPGDSFFNDALCKAQEWQYKKFIKKKKISVKRALWKMAGGIAAT